MRLAVTATVLGALVTPAWGAPGQVPAPLAPAAQIIQVEFWCSPGFEPRHGRCIATRSRDELFLYQSESFETRRLPPQGLRERY